MKKLLCVLMFGMMFGQAELTTRLYTIALDMDAYGTISIDMLDVTGYDLPSAIINVVSIENNTNDNINLNWGCDVIEENILIQHSISSNTVTPPRTSIYVANENCFIKLSSSNPLTNSNSSLSMQITAEFPQEETGYIDEGFDYCLHTGANLVSSPCRDEVAIESAIPSDILQNITGIITEGGAASNLGGNWVGSLNGLGGGKGYWVISDIDGCFN